MSLKRKLAAKLVAGAFAATVASSALASFEVIVDLFTVPQLVEDVLADATPVVDSTLTGLDSILGGQRDISVNLTDPGQTGAGVDLNIGVNPDTDQGELTFSVDSGTAGTGIIQWDGADQSIALDFDGLGGIDLTAGGGTGFSFTTLNSDGDFTFEVLLATDEDNFATVLIQAHDTTLTGPVFSFIPFTAFTDFCVGFVPTGDVLAIDCTGAVDITAIGAIQVTLDPTGSAGTIDLGISQITILPEPGSLALLAGALLLGGAVTRRRLKA